MAAKSLTLLTMGVVGVFSASWAVADYSWADLTGDCFVDFEDFSVIGAGWLNGYDWNDVNTLADQWLTPGPCVPDDMVCIPDGNFVMGDHFSPEGYEDEVPLHDVLLDAFFMSRYETTNQRYCDYLNSAYDACDIQVDGGKVYASSDDSNSYPYCHLHSFAAQSQIDYNDVSETFSVRTKGGRDMSDDPMVCVSWYGSAAYCNWRSSEEGYEACYNLTWHCNFSKHGYRLPTEAEWEYAARGGQHSPYRRFPWGDTISHSQANYYADPCSYSYDVSPTSGYHPDWNDGIIPYTSPVGTFSVNGYGLYDMAGNVWEWCNDWYASDYYETGPYDNPTGPWWGSKRVHRGGPSSGYASYCRVADRDSFFPVVANFIRGFRIVLDLE